MTEQVADYTGQAKALYEQARDILAKLDVKLDVRQPARGLTLAAQQTGDTHHKRGSIFLSSCPSSIG